MKKNQNLISLKHLAREFNLDPYAFRMALRAADLKPQINKRWKWESKEEEEYIKAWRVARDLSSRSKNSLTS